MTGTFDFGIESGKTALPLIPRCQECGLYRKCQSPKMAPYGDGKRSILILGEAPGSEEDQQGRPFIGPSGQLLREVLDKFGVDVDRDCLTTNALICHPDRNKIANPRMIDWCRPNLVKTLEEFKPKTIIVLGNSAIKSLIGWLWRADTGNMSRWDGWQIPCQQLNAWLCPTFHPAYILRSDYGVSQRGNDVRRSAFERHLKAAVELEERPWRKVPDYASKVRVCVNPDDAVETINHMGLLGNPVAFDFETDRLKPDHENARIVCCSLSDGKDTIAYPWHGRAIEATKELLESPVPKIGFNIAFEQRWARRFGICIKNWAWCGQTAAHVLDNRPRITNLEFQAFVLLGQAPWDEGVSKHLEGDSSNAPNRVRDVPLERLLLYCGLDSLLEWKVAKKQAKLMEVAAPACSLAR